MTCKHSFDEIELAWANGLCAYCLLYALAEAQNAGFKLTAALCALPEDDKEKISRPRVMELVIAWRSDLDAAKEQKK